MYIHNDLKENEELICPFCDKQLTTLPNAVNQCCSEISVKNVDGENVCINCGTVHGYYVTEYFDFYDNMNEIRQKSVYNRKYHIENVLNSISSENYIQLTYHQRERIHKVFVEIGSVLNEVNDGRKRMISIKYLIKQLFKMLGLPYKDIVEEDIKIL